MVATKNETVSYDSFVEYDDARILYFDLNQDGITCHYLKDGKTATIHGDDWNSIKAQWNYRVF